MPTLMEAIVLSRLTFTQPYQREQDESPRARARVAADKRVEPMESWIVRRLAVGSIDWLGGSQMLAQFHDTIPCKGKFGEVSLRARQSLQDARRSIKTKTKKLALRT